MRHYEIGRWGISFIFDLRGSVIPKAMVWAIPNAALAAGLTYLVSQYSHMQQFMDIDTLSISQVWQSYNWLIGFLLTFRTGQAYARWWEGGTLLQQARGEWFNAYSSCIAFSTTDKARQAEVMHFHRLLATLMSLLYSCALYQISQTDAADFDIVDTARLDVESMQFLMKSTDKVEVIMQWIQRLVVEQMGSGVVPIPAPVITRVFQELSRGVVNINNVRKICEFPFPFPYAQLSMVMLLVHFILTPVLSALLLESWRWAALTSWVSVFALWSLNYVASEIECPFGDDENDLPMLAMQKYMNRTLLALLEPRAQTVPTADTEVQLMPQYDDSGWTKHLFEPGMVTRRRIVSVYSDSAILQSHDGDSVDGSQPNGGNLDRQFSPWQGSEQSAPSGAGILSRLAGRFVSNVSRGASANSFADHEAGCYSQSAAGSGGPPGGGGTPGIQRGGIEYRSETSSHTAAVFDQDPSSARQGGADGPGFLSDLSLDISSEHMEDQARKAKAFLADAGSESACASEAESESLGQFTAPSPSSSSIPGHHHAGPGPGGGVGGGVGGGGGGGGSGSPTYRAGGLDASTGGHARALERVDEEGYGPRLSGHSIGSSHSGVGIMLRCRTTEKPSASQKELKDQI